MHNIGMDFANRDSRGAGGRRLEASTRSNSQSNEVAVKTARRSRNLYAGTGTTGPSVQFIPAPGITEKYP